MSTKPETLLSAEYVAGLVERLSQLRFFLNGQGQLDGLSFGDRRAVTARINSAFWWRSYLAVIGEAATTISTLAARVEEAERENESLRLAICGGEDAPGYAASLPLEAILQVARDNRQSAARDAELAWDGETATSWKSRALAAETNLHNLQSALEKVTAQRDEALAETAREQFVSPSIASRIAELMVEGDGFWVTCSGCHESEDGYDVGHYPHSQEFGCKLGGGCSECGGLGALWDTTDYDDMARSIIADEAAEAETARMRKALEEIARGNVPPDKEGHYLAHRACVKLARDALKPVGGQ